MSNYNPLLAKQSFDKKYPKCVKLSGLLYDMACQTQISYIYDNTDLDLCSVTNEPTLDAQLAYSILVNGLES